MGNVHLCPSVCVCLCVCEKERESWCFTDTQRCVEITHVLRTDFTLNNVIKLIPILFESGPTACQYLQSEAKPQEI